MLSVCFSGLELHSLCPYPKHFYPSDRVLCRKNCLRVENNLLGSETGATLCFTMSKFAAQCFARPLTITLKLPFVAFVHVTMILCVKFNNYFTFTFYYFHKSIIKIILSEEEQVFKVSLVSFNFSEMKEVHPSILCFTWSAQKMSNTLFGKSSLCDVTNYTNTWLVRSSKLKGRLPARCLFQPPDCSVFVTFHFCHLAYHERFCWRLWTDLFVVLILHGCTTWVWVDKWWREIG